MASRFPRNPDKWSVFESQTFLDASKQEMTIAQFEELITNIRHAGEAKDILGARNNHEAIVETAKFMKNSDPKLFMKIIGRVDRFRKRLERSSARSK